MAFQEKRAGAVIPGRKEHAAAFRTGGDRSLEGGGIIRHAVAPGAEAADIEGIAFLLRVEAQAFLRTVCRPGGDGIIRIRTEIEQGEYGADFDSAQFIYFNF